MDAGARHPTARELYAQMIEGRITDAAARRLLAPRLAYAAAMYAPRAAELSQLGLDELDGRLHGIIRQL